MQTEQLIPGSHVTTRRRKSLSALQKLIRQLSRAADEMRAQRRYDVAEPLYLRALELAELFCGREDVGPLCNNLAALYKYMGRFDEAERLYLRALPLMEQSLGAEHPEIATLYHDLGWLEYARGHFAAGEPLARRSVEISERALGPHHPDVAADIAALADILSGQRKREEAESLSPPAPGAFACHSGAA